MSEASNMLAVGQDFEYGEKKYHLRPFTLGDEGVFEAWLEEQAYKTVQRNRRIMDEDEYKIALGDVAVRSAAGEFDFVGLVAQKSLRSPSGIKKVMQMTLEAVGHDTIVDEELIDKMYNDKLMETIEYLNRINSDPKVKAELRRAQRRSAK